MTGTQRCDEILRLIDEVLAHDEASARGKSDPHSSERQLGNQRSEVDA